MFQGYYSYGYVSALLYLRLCFRVAIVTIMFQGCYSYGCVSVCYSYGCVSGFAIVTVVFQGCYVIVTRVRAVGGRTERASLRRVADASPPTPRRTDGRGPSMGE